jgi:hypothetical protein
VNAFIVTQTAQLHERKAEALRREAEVDRAIDQAETQLSLLERKLGLDGGRPSGPI